MGKRDDQAAAARAALGRPVTLKIGGMTGWREEGLPVAEGAGPGAPGGASSE
jgi:rhodanese-related sulfurtransferase